MYLDYIEKMNAALQKIEFSSGKLYNVADYNRLMGYLVDIFSENKIDDKYLFFIGNGGSAAIASHMTADFMKNGDMKTVSLYDNPLTTCMGNDYGYQEIFSKPLSIIGNEGDLLVAISSSGNSANIVNAIKTAHEKGMKVLTFTGFRSDNKVRSLGDYNLWVPCEEYGTVESIHLIILQQVVDEILKRDGTGL